MKTTLAYLIGAGMLMSLSALPAAATPVLSFSGSFSSAFAAANQTITSSGTDVVTGLSGIFLNSLTVQGAGAADGVYTLGYTTETLDTVTKIVTVAGSVTGCAAAYGGTCSLTNIGSVLTTLFAFSLPGAPSITGITSTGSAGSLSFNNATSLSNVNSRFLSDLGFLAPPVGTVTVSGGLTGTPTTSTSHAFYTTSNTLSVTLTPEPDTFLLMGTALLAFGLLTRRVRRRPRAQTSPAPPAK